MIKKERSIPLIILQLEALNRRLIKGHPAKKDIEVELKRRWSGYQGELSINYYLDFLPQKDSFIFHGLRLPNQFDKYFQIDTLILTPSFILIMEIKNLIGELLFDPIHKQLIQISNSGKEVYDDPVLQVKRQEQQLARFLSRQKLPQLPIQSLVIVSHSSALLQFTGRDRYYEDNVIRASFIPDKFEMIRKKHHEKILTMKEMQKIARALLKKDTPHAIDVLSRFHLNYKDLIKGVHCPNCFFIPMHYHRGKWSCQTCGYQSREAYIDSLHDYALLVGLEMTNEQCRDFLAIDSPSICRRLLGNLQLTHHGDNRARVYILTYPVS